MLRFHDSIESDPETRQDQRHFPIVGVDFPKERNLMKWSKSIELSQCENYRTESDFFAGKSIVVECWLYLNQNDTNCKQMFNPPHCKKTLSFP